VECLLTARTSLQLRNLEKKKKKAPKQTAEHDAMRSHLSSYLVLKVVTENQAGTAHPALATFPAQYIPSSSQEAKLLQ